MRLLASAAVVVLALGACQGTRYAEPPPAPAVPTDFPTEALDGDSEAYVVDPGVSLLVVRVYRDGPLARLGHNHIVSTSAVGGYARRVEGEALAADLFVPVAEVVVDDPALRAAAGEEFSSVPSDEDIDGTRNNMLGPAVLDAASYPFVRARAILPHDPRQPGVSDTAPMEVRFEVRGVSRTLVLPAIIDSGDGHVRLRASATLNQSDFGIEPFSVLGGALRVRDALDLAIDLVFVPADADVQP